MLRRCALKCIILKGQTLFKDTDQYIQQSKHNKQKWMKKWNNNKFILSLKPSDECFKLVYLLTFSHAYTEETKDKFNSMTMQYVCWYNNHKLLELIRSASQWYHHNFPEFREILARCRELICWYCDGACELGRLWQKSHFILFAYFKLVFTRLVNGCVYLFITRKWIVVWVFYFQCSNFLARFLSVLYPFLSDFMSALFTIIYLLQNIYMFVACV